MKLPFALLSEFSIGDVVAQFWLDDASEKIGLRLLPIALKHEVVSRRETLAGLPEIDVMPEVAPNAWELDPLVHLKLVGDNYSGAFAQGHTMLGAPSNDRLRYADQHVEYAAGMTRVVTMLSSAEGLEIRHILWWYEGEEAVRSRVEFYNGSGQAVKLEQLTSLSLGGITPFASDDAANRLKVHRFRSGWSAEGRHDCQTVEELHLERSWSGASKFSERFGQVGSMPVRKWFPFVAVEDSGVGVIWAAQVAWAGSWQLEVFRQHDTICLAGGLADREFGHWMKTVAPGCSFSTPEGRMTCVRGSIYEACERLTALQERALEQLPEVEQSLPIVFNEWCTTWGYPDEERIDALASRLSGTGVEYLVIDAGWYQGEHGNWSTGHGDWIPSAKLFSNGLKGVADIIRSYGLTPGLWFEMETVGDCSAAYQKTDWLLKRDSVPLSVRNRRFWDLSNSEVIEHLCERVAGQLESSGMGYLKVDYNETIGLGCDHPDGVGEGLRCQIEGVHELFRRIRERLPHLVIENCSSGGHRLEPSMMELTAMSSFSDAHETVEIPLIAANLHQLMLPRQSQIWAVLHASDTELRIVYSLSATFLGRMALSGEVDRLSDIQANYLQKAIDLYRKVYPIIRNGKSQLIRCYGPSWRHPEGWQAMLRKSVSEDELLIVIHAFDKAPQRAAIPLPEGQWRIEADFGVGTSAVEIDQQSLTCMLVDFCGRVLHMKRSV